jgi:hypothetical protein
VSSGHDSFSHYSFHAGDGWRVTCSAYADAPPILSLNGSHSAVSIAARGTDASVSAVEFARALAREARRFLDEMERMRRAQLDGNGDTKAAGSDAA